MTSPSAVFGESLIGRRREELDTPALLLDLDRFEANVERLSGAIAAGGKAWRPHSKGHKSPWIARRQMDHGAIGVTCAKVSEAASSMLTARAAATTLINVGPFSTKARPMD